jgi:hypothetical protein
VAAVAYNLAATWHSVKNERNIGFKSDLSPIAIAKMVETKLIVKLRFKSNLQFIYGERNCDMNRSLHSTSFAIGCFKINLLELGY